MPTVFPLTVNSGFLLDWGALYKVCGMLVGTLCFYTAQSFTAGTPVEIGVFNDTPSVQNASFVATDSYMTSDVLGAVLLDTYNKRLIFTPTKTFTEARICFTVAVKAH